VKVTLSKGNANISIPLMRGIVNVSIAKTEDVAFRQVNITAANNVSNAKIMIYKITSLPSSASGISSLAYHNIRIDKANFTDSDLSYVHIKFVVNKTWLTANGIALTNISLYRWTDRWNELVTNYQSNTSSEVFYVAESPGFSYFLIGTKGGIIVAAPIVEPTQCVESWSCTEWSDCNGVQTRTCTDSNTCGTTVSKPTESQSCTIIAEEKVQADNSWLYPTVGVAIVVLASLLFLFSRRNTFRVSKKSKR
jgi:PGF-pre-PGF domain-containing protein